MSDNCHLNQSNFDSKNSILRVLLMQYNNSSQISNESQQNSFKNNVPYKIVFTDLLLKKLKENFGSTIVPIIHKMILIFINLTDFLIKYNFKDYFSEFQKCQCQDIESSDSI